MWVALIQDGVNVSDKIEGVSVDRLVVLYCRIRTTRTAFSAVGFTKSRKLFLLLLKIRYP